MNGRIVRQAVMGAVAAIAWAIPSAALVTLLYRFPYPLAEEYLAGPRDALLAMLSAIFYLQFGGFLFLGVAGALTGVVVDRFARGDRKKAGRLVLGFAAVPALLAAITLAVLEEFIGQW